MAFLACMRPLNDITLIIIFLKRVIKTFGMKLFQFFGDYIPKFGLT